MDRALKIAKSFSLAFSRDSRALATLSRDVFIWDLHSRKKKVRAHPCSNPSSACFSPNGEQLGVKSTSGVIALISTKDGTLIRDFNNLTDGEGSNLQFSACGEFIVDGSWDGRILVRRALSARIEFSAEFPGEMIAGVHCDAKGDTWVFEHHRKATSQTASPAPCYFSVWRWPFNHGSVILPAQVPFARTSALTSDATRLAVVHGAPPTELTIFDIVDGTLSAHCNIHSGGTGSALAWSPKADFLGSVQDGKVIIYRAESLKPFRDFALAYPSDIAFSPDGRLVAIGSWESGLVLPNVIDVTPTTA
jgi:WD40 repeat protein